MERTKTADLLYQRAKRIIQSISDLEKELSTQANLQTLKIVIPPMIGELVLTKLLKAAKQLSTELEIIESASVEAVNYLTKSEADVAIMIVDGTLGNELLSIDLTEQKLLYTVSKKHHHAQKKAVYYKDLDNESIILMRKDSFQNLYLQKQFERHLVKPKIVLYSNQISTIKKLISEGKTGAFIMQSLINTDEQVGIMLEDDIVLDIRVVWMRNGHLSGKAKQLIISMGKML